MVNRKRVFFILLLFFLFFPQKIKAAIFINEIMPNPAGDDKEAEWVELFNTDRSSLLIDGYVLEDKNGKRITLSGSFIDWFVLYPKGEHGFALTNSGSTIKLFNASTSAEPIDTFSYTDSDDNDSWGRIPDGGGTVQLVAASRGGANVVVTPSPSPTSKPTASPTPKKTAQPTAKADFSTPIPSPSVFTLNSQKSVAPLETPSENEAEKETSESGVVLSAIDSNSDSFQNPKPSQNVQFPKNRAPFLFSFGGILFVAGGCFMGWMQYKRQLLV